MRVLYVCADRGIALHGRKGASVHVRSLTAAFGQLGHQVALAVAALGPDGRAGVGQPESERSSDSAAPSPEVLLLDADPISQQAQISARLATFRPDVVIERYSLQSGATRAATAQHGVALTMEVNAPLVREATRHRGLRDPDAQRREEQVLAAADRIQVVSSELLRYVQTVAPSVPSTWIPNGADVDAFSAASPASLPGVDGRLVVGFTGSMKRWHGVDDLLTAFASLPSAVKDSACLVLVGTGPCEEELRERAAGADLEGWVIFTGHVPYEHVPGLVQLFDIAAAPYRPMPDFYFHPLKVVEYLAAGKPVVYAQQGDVAELTGQAGLGYLAGSPTALADRLAQLISDAALRERMGEAARKVREAHRWTATARRVLDFAAHAAFPAPAEHSDSA